MARRKSTPKKRETPHEPQREPLAPGVTALLKGDRVGPEVRSQRTEERGGHTPLRVAVTGGTGMLGRALCERLIGRGDEVVMISRDPTAAEEKVRGAARYVAWNGINVGPWVSTLEGVDAVVHLAGAPWMAQGLHVTEAQVRRSRVLATRAVVDGLGGLRQPPRAFLSASSAHVYGLHGGHDEPVDERAAGLGSDPTSRSLRDWEQAASGAREHEIRTVFLRFGAVLAPHNGMLPLMVSLFDRHLGGTLLPRRAWRPWIHLEDAVGLMILAIENPKVSGGLNVTSPSPVRSREFSKLLGSKLERGSWMPLPKVVFQRFAGPAAAVQLKPVKRVVPQKALELGYTFQYPQLEDALSQLIVARRREHAGNAEWSASRSG